jgi:surfactin synthase thioesterase subunit
VHRRDDAGVLAELRRVGGSDERTLSDPELAALIAAAARADYQAIETYAYVPGPPLRCPVTALIGSDDPQCTEAEAAAWSRHTTGPFELLMHPGGHFYLNTHRQSVARLVAESLAHVAHP